MQLLAPSGRDEKKRAYQPESSLAARSDVEVARREEKVKRLLESRWEDPRATR
jgi:hypothetical protein